MPITLVDVLRQSIDDLHGRMNAIEAGAVADSRDTLTDVEQTTWDELRAEAEAKTSRMELLVGRGELDHKAGELFGRLSGRTEREPAVPVTDKADFPYRTPGEYVLAYMRTRHGDTAEAARFQRALADVTTAQTPGLVPPQVTGDILGQWLARRPSVDAMTKPALPPVGLKVQRPRITQHTDVGPHAEKQPVVSQAFTLDLLEITVASYAGAVDVSWELANRSSPGALDLIFSDLVAVYARKSNVTAFSSAFGTDVTQSVAWDGTAEGFAATIAAASVMIATNSAEQVWPDTIWMGLTSYGVLAGLVDGGGRPLFPYLAPQNAYGTADAAGTISSVMGLRPVIDPTIPPNSFVVGQSEEVEFYETPGAPVQLSVVDVGVAGYNIGVIGMFAAKAVDPKAFVKVTYTPPAALADIGNGGNGGTKAAK